MQNGYIESFNGRMRDELLNESLFIDLDQARRLIGLGRRLQHSEAAFLARLQNAGRLCWYTDRAEGRNIGRGSNCRWMKAQWRVSGTAKSPHPKEKSAKQVAWRPPNYLWYHPKPSSISLLLYLL